MAILFFYPWFDDPYPPEYRLNVRNKLLNNIGLLPIQGLGTEHRTESRTEEGMKNTRCRVGGKSELGNNF